MKIKKLRKKLNLNKKTVADLNIMAMREINGGNDDPNTRYVSCPCPTSGLCTGIPVCKDC